MVLTHKNSAGARLIAGLLLLWLALFRAAAANSPPVANPDSYTLNEDTTLTNTAPGVLVNDTDPDGNPIQAIVVTLPVHGTLVLNTNGAFSYRPFTNYNGPDSFTYRARDTGGATSAVAATVTFTINPTNDVPLATNDSYSVNADTTLTVSAPGVLANDGDVDGDALTALLVTSVSSGTLVLNPNGSFTYTPPTNFSGSVAFTYRARDAVSTSAVATATITVTAMPLTVITPPPASQTVCSNSTVTLSVTATGTALTYQWRKNGAAISGKTNSILILGNVTSADAATYSVRITNSVSATTNSSVLTVIPGVVVTLLTNAVRYVGSVASFSTLASGGSGPITYSWAKDGVVIPNQTSRTLLLSNLNVTATATYSVTASLTNGCSATASATLLVAYCFVSLDAMLVIDRSGSMSGQPYLDAKTAATNFVRHLILGTNADIAGIVSYNPTSNLDQRLTNNVVPVEQAIHNLPAATGGTCISCGLNTAQAELTSIRHRSGALPVMVLLSDGKPHDFDTPTEALTNAAAAKLAGTRLFTVGLNDGSGTNVDIPLMQAMASSTNDFFYANDSSQLPGIFDQISAILCRGPNDIVGPTPNNATVCAGANVEFDVTATGCAIFAFEWLKDGMSLPGQTNTFLLLNSVTAADAGVYTVIVSSFCGNFTNSATLTVQTPAQILIGPLSQIRCAGASVTFNALTSGDVVSYQWRKGVASLPGQTNSSLTLTNVTAADAGNYTIVITGLCNSSANSTAALTVNTPPVLTPLTDVVSCPNRVVVFQTTASGTGPFSYLWRMNGAVIPGETTNVLTLASVNAAGAGIYSVEATGPCGAATNAASLVVLTNTTATPLTSLVRCVGQPANFSTTPGGTGPFTFVWRKGGVVIPGANGASLSFASVTTNDAGVYSVEVGGACNFVTNSAALSVNRLTTATPLADATVCFGSTVSFATVAQGTGPFTYVWRKDGAVISGATSASLILSNVTTADTGTYAVEVSGTCNSVTNVAALLVRALTTATALSGATRCVGEPASFATTPGGTGPFTFVWRRDGVVLAAETNSSLTFASVTTNVAGVYSVTVSGTCNAVTRSATLVVNELTTATPLADAAVCAGDVASFATVPNGAGPFTFVWRRDGQVFSDATNASFTIASAVAEDSGIYTVEVTGLCNAVTNAATLLVRNLTAASPLADATRCTGENVTFSTVASGTGPFTFVWRRNGVEILGATNSLLPIASVTTNDAGLYTVEVGGVCHAVTNGATLVVHELTMATALDNVTACAGDTVSFSTVVQGAGPFTFVWRRDGEVIDGATNSSLVISLATAADTGTYSVEVSGVCNSVTNSAALVVRELTTATALSGATRCVSEPVRFSTTPGGTGPFTFVWRRDGVEIPGATNSSLLLADVTTGDSGLYSVEVRGACRAVTNTAALLVFAPAAAAPLADAAVCPGGSASFATVVPGAGPFTFVWRKDGAVVLGATNSSLTISNATAADSGTYAVEVTGGCNSVTNTGALLLREPTSVAPLADAVRCAGDGMSFSALAAGAGPFTFVWRRDGLVISGATNATLGLSNLTTADGGTYSVQAFGACNSASRTATLLVRESTVATPLADTALCVGESVTFQTEAEGLGPFSFVWRKNGALIAGATNDSLAISIAVVADGGTYSVEVSGACNTVTNQAVLTVRSLAGATFLLDATRCAGGSVSFTTRTGGTGPLTLVWRKDGVLIPGETGPTLVLNNLTTNETGVYALEVGGPCNSVTNRATLTVKEWTTATLLADATACTGESVSFTTVAQGAGPFTYVWRKNGVLISRATNASLTLTNLMMADGGIYAVQVSGVCNAVTNTATLFVREQTTATPLAGATRCAGEGMIFNTEAEGTGPFTFRWRKDGLVISGATNSALAFASVTTNDAGLYSVEVSGACNAVTNRAALVVNELTTATPLENAAVCAGGSAWLATVAQGTGPFTFAWRKDGALLDGATNASLLLSNLSPTDSGGYAVEVSGACHAVTNTATLLVRALTGATPFSDLTRCVGGSAVFNTEAGGTGPFTFVWRKDGAEISGATNGTLSFANVTTNDAGLYSVEVSGACNAVTNRAALIVNEPVAATPLAGLVRCVGTAASFSTVPSGTGPFVFAWRKDGALLANETNGVLTFVVASTNAAGNYSVEVSGACGTVTNGAVLGVNALTVALPLADQSHCAGDNATFVAEPAGPGPFSFVWRKNGVLIPTAAGNALQLTNLAAADSGVFSVEIAGPCNAVTNVATLTIIGPPSALVSQTRCLGDTAVFSTTVSGTGPYSFAWRKGTALLAGETNSSLVLSNLTANDSAAYRVEVTGPCGSFTNGATLSVLQKTSATAMSGQSRCAGLNASFITIASGSGPFTYVWRKDGAVLPGRTSFSITITNIAPADAGQYSVEVTGGCNTVTNSATLTINTVALISALTNLSVCPGQDALFAPLISGSGAYTNVWKKNGVLLAGETNATLLLPAVNAGSAGTYSLEVRGACGHATNSAVLALRTNAIVAALANQLQCPGGTATFTANVSGAGPFAFVWKKNGAVISGVTTSVLTLTNLAPADTALYTVEVAAPCNTASASATLTVDALTTATPLQDVTVCAGQPALFSTTPGGGGATFSFVWRKDGVVLPGQTNSTLYFTNTYVTNAGLYSVEVTGCSRVTNSALLTVRPMLSATMPANVTACSCEDLILGPSVSGAGPFTYVWRKNGARLEGETNLVLDLHQLNTASPGNYTVEISGLCNNVTNTTAVEVITVTSGRWTNASPILIPEFGAAAPYPSPILVRCAPKTVSQLRVTLLGLRHSFPDDVDIALVGPGGQAIKLISDAGGGGANELTGVDLTFDDNAPGFLSDGGFIQAGTYRPSNYDGGEGDVFQSPGPPTNTVYSTNLSVYFGTNPNGLWKLFVADDHGLNLGSLDGWILDFGHGEFVAQNLSLSAPLMLPDGAFQMKLSGEANKKYYLEASTDLKQWDIIQTNVLEAASMILTDPTAPLFHYRFYRASGCRD